MISWFDLFMAHLGMYAAAGADVDEMRLKIAIAVQSDEFWEYIKRARSIDQQIMREITTDEHDPKKGN